MKRKVLFLSVLCVLSLFSVSCFKTPDVPPAEPVEFDFQVMVEDLDTEYAEFAKKYKESIVYKDDYSASIILKGVYVIGNVPYGLRIFVNGDAYGNIDKIIAQPEDSNNSRALWNHFVANASALGLGMFDGAKYRTSSGAGKLVSYEEVLAFFDDSNNSNALIAPAYIYDPDGEVRILSMYESGYFGLVIMDNYLTADVNVYAGWPGKKYEYLSTTYFTLAEEQKNRLVFSNARDVLGNRFSVEAVARESTGIVENACAVLDEDVLDGWDDVLSVWKTYAKNEEESKLSLGRVVSVELVDGKTVEKKFENVGEAIAYIEETGRPAEGSLDIRYAIDRSRADVYVRLDSDSLIVEGVLAD